MKYTRDAYERAEKTLGERRTKAFDERDERFERAAAVLPEISGLERSLSKKRFDYLRSIGSSDKGSAVTLSQLREETEKTEHIIEQMLISAELPDDYLDYHFTCSKCKDTGYRDGVRCECMTKLLEQYTVEELNKQCSIKLHSFDEFRLDYYPETADDGDEPRRRMQTVFNNCRTYAEDFDGKAQSLFMYGRTGLGKTFLSSCIAAEVMSRGYSVVFFSFPTLFSKLEDEHFGRSDDKTMEILMSAELVILDDLGSEFKTQFTEAKLYEIVNGRMNLEKPTIISTNMTARQLQETYNERIISRVMMEFAPLRFAGNDIRQIIRRNTYIKNT